MSSSSPTDRIQKRALLRAPVERVWRALTTAKEFGEWFRLALDGEFSEGRPIRGKVLVAGFEHMVAELFIERIEPQRYFSYRWHPAAIEPNVDYSAEPTTLVELELRAVEGGTELTITESGFDAIPAARRAEAFRLNEGGWSAQTENIRAYVESR